MTSTPESAKPDFKLGSPAVGLSPPLHTEDSPLPKEKDAELQPPPAIAAGLPEEKDAELALSLSGFSSEDTTEDIILRTAADKVNKYIMHTYMCIQTYKCVYYSHSDWLLTVHVNLVWFCFPSASQ